ncbi:MAG TPA: methyltransferase domain-containing protein [Candidatus Nanoarchaeia archaeon]|nr:methyltransferase domain-containing protein [Candidatus Nanoarchaeia archaeon]
MREQKFTQIKAAYDDYYKELLRNGKLPLRSTELGFWNAAITGEVFEAFRKLKLSKKSSFIDLGSGDGKVTLLASLFCSRAEGIEIDDELHHKALEIKDKLGISNVVFHHDDFNEHSIEGYDIVFINPDKPLQRGLEKKLLNELSGKLILFGHHFHPSNLVKEKEVVVDNTLVAVYNRF